MNRDPIRKHLPIAELWDALGQSVDVLVCCGSYEDRCRTVADVIPPDAVKKAIVAHNTNLDEYVAANSRYLRERFGDRAVDVPTDSTDPLRTADELSLALEQVATGDAQQYLIDTTTFTHEALLILMRLLSERLGSAADIRFVYSTAAEYSIGEPDSRKWLSKGVVDVRSVLGYSGEYTSSRQTHLIVMVGYEHERAEGLIDVVEPDELSLGLGYGSPGLPLPAKHEAARLAYEELLRQMEGMRGPGVVKFRFCSDDPWDSEQAVAQRVAAFPDCNVIVAPMNTKVSTIGAALVATKDESIQLCYAQPLQYNYEGYSAPGDTCHLFEVNELFKGR